MRAGDERNPGPAKREGTKKRSRAKGVRRYEPFCTDSDLPVVRDLFRLRNTYHWTSLSPSTSSRSQRRIASRVREVCYIYQTARAALGTDVRELTGRKVFHLIGYMRILTSNPFFAILAATKGGRAPSECRSTKRQHYPSGSKHPLEAKWSNMQSK